MMFAKHTRPGNLLTSYSFTTVTTVTKYKNLFSPCCSRGRQSSGQICWQTQVPGNIILIFAENVWLGMPVMTQSWLQWDPSYTSLWWKSCLIDNLEYRRDVSVNNCRTHSRVLPDLMKSWFNNLFHNCQINANNNFALFFNRKVWIPIAVENLEC